MGRGFLFHVIEGDQGGEGSTYDYGWECRLREEGDRKGQYSIRINDQWRICFKWSGVDAHEVEITD